MSDIIDQTTNVTVYDESGNQVDLAKDATSQGIVDAIGEESGSNLLTKIQSLWDKLVELFNTGVAKIKLWDGTNIANISADGSLYVTIPPSATNQTVQVAWDRPHTASINYQWQDVLEYTVPTGYDLNALSFQASSEVSNEKARAVNRQLFGSFVGTTDTFTDGYICTSPKFACRLYLELTSASGSNNDIITITYTNTEGTTGRTATVTIPKNTTSGAKFEVYLQDEDSGFLDITNITHSQTGQTIDFNAYGMIELFFLILTASDVLYQSTSTALGGIVVLEGGTLYLQYKANSTSSNIRRLSFLGTLVEKVTT